MPNIKTKEIKLEVPESLSMLDLLGQRDELLKVIEGAFQSRIVVRGNKITINGGEKEAEIVLNIFNELLDILNAGERLTKQSVTQTVDLIKAEDDDLSPKDIFSDTILVHRGKAIGPKTPGQKRYVDTIRSNTATFAIGPAGTGKTYLAMAMAVEALSKKMVSRIILTRPAVEAGEKLGFLPGTLFEKVDPYLRPLYDALFDMMETDRFSQLLDTGSIEVAPLAYMRGRTLNESFIILDEAQNTSPEQMKMFLTRLGFGSKIVITGDVTQIDLPRGKKSGLVVIENILNDINDLKFIRLSSKDVIRHKLVQKIVEAYRRYEENKEGQ